MPGRRQRRLVLWFCEPPALSDPVDRRVDDEFQDRGGNDAPHHRGGDPLHHIGAGAIAEHNGDEPREDHGDRHDLRPDPLYGTVHDALPQIIDRFHPPLFSPLVIGQIEIEEHDDARLRVETGPSPSKERQNKSLLQHLFPPLFPFHLINLPKSELHVEVAGRMKSLECP